MTREGWIIAGQLGLVGLVAWWAPWWLAAVVVAAILLWPRGLGRGREGRTSA